MFTRLLLSLVHTGIAPTSFYKPLMGGRRPHYNGLPVDFIARSMVAIGTRPDVQDFSTFHVENPHDDGVSLDRIVDWIIAEGYPIARIDGYDEWLQRFEARLQGLPEKRRQQSSLAILAAFSTPDGDAKPIHCQRFRDKVRQLATDDSGDIPQLTRAFIGKCLNDMLVLDMVDERH
jgi:fatty acid CoA ligase FadD9